MKRENIIRNIINYKTKSIKEETIIKITPDKNKCFQSKKTGHRFIHTKKHIGLPLFVREEKDINIYNEVNI